MPRLRVAIDLALEQPSQIDSEIVIHTKHRRPYTSLGIKRCLCTLKTKTLDLALNASKSQTSNMRREKTSFYLNTLMFLKVAITSPFTTYKGKG